MYPARLTSELSTYASVSTKGVVEFNWSKPALTQWLSRTTTASVGGVLIPPTPMGTAPLSVRWEAESAQRADRGEAHEQFTQVRAARMRKTLLLLCGLY